MSFDYKFTIDGDVIPDLEGLEEDFSESPTILPSSSLQKVSSLEDNCPPRQTTSSTSSKLRSQGSSGLGKSFRLPFTSSKHNPIKHRKSKDDVICSDSKPTRDTDFPTRPQVVVKQNSFDGLDYYNKSSSFVLKAKNNRSRGSGVNENLKSNSILSRKQSKEKISKTDTVSMRSIDEVAPLPPPPPTASSKDSFTERSTIGLVLKGKLTNALDDGFIQIKHDVDFEKNVVVLQEFYYKVAPNKTNIEEHCRRLLKKYTPGNIAVSLEKKYGAYPEKWEKEMNYMKSKGI